MEKTPLDLQKYGSARDLGIALKGSLDHDKRVKYHLMFANGAGTRSETNKGKKIFLSLGFDPTPSATLQVYGDWEDQSDLTRYTVQGFAAYKTHKMRVGAQFAHQTRSAPNQDDENLEIASVFGAFKLSEKTEAFGRFDHMFDPAPSGISYIPFNNSAESSNLVVVGLSYSLDKNVYIIPNVEIVLYGEDAGGIEPDPDFISRVTVYYRFR